MRLWHALALATLSLVLSPRALAQDAWNGVYQGTVGKMPVRVCLDFDGRSAYRYMRHAGEIALTAHGSNWEEFTNGTVTGRWSVAMIPDGDLSGRWSSPDSLRQLPVVLHRVAREDSGPACESAAYRMLPAPGLPPSPPKHENDETNMARQPASRIAAGFEHALVVKADGTLWAWGSNAQGQLASGSTDNDKHPEPRQIDSGYIEVAAGGDTSYALRVDGSLWAWGSNAHGEYGDGTVTSSYLPKRIAVNVAHMVAEEDILLVLKRDGSLWASGRGPMGNAERPDHSYTPVKIGDDYGAVAVSTNSGAAISRKGIVQNWGNDVWLDRSNPRPTVVGGFYSQVAWAGGGYGALTPEGHFYAWGRFSDGNNNYYDVKAPLLYGKQRFRGIGSLCSTAALFDYQDRLWVRKFPIPAERSQALMLVAEGVAEVTCGGPSGDLLLKIDGSLWTWNQNDGNNLNTPDYFSRMHQILTGVALP